MGYYFSAPLVLWRRVGGVPKDLLAPPAHFPALPSRSEVGLQSLSPLTPLQAQDPGSASPGHSPGASCGPGHGI